MHCGPAYYQCGSILKFGKCKGLEGKQALFVLNLPEKKMAGEISQGMLFDIGYADKVTACLAIPELPVPNGSRAG